MIRGLLTIVSIISDKNRKSNENVEYNRIEVYCSYEKTYKGKRALALLPETG